MFSSTEIMSLGLALPVAIGIGYTLFLMEAHSAGPWLKRRKRLMEMAQEFGLTVDGSGESAQGTLEGLPFHISLRSVRRSKSSTMVLSASLKLPDCPVGFRLKEENFLTGVSRVFGSEELSLGDPEFDAAFFVGGESVEEIQSYLTPAIRGALLRGLPGLPLGEVKEGEVRSSKSFALPFSLVSHFRPLLEGYRDLARELQSLETVPVGKSGVVEAKVRKFARNSLVLWLPFCILALTQGEYPEDSFIQGFSILALVISLAALSANEVARLILQGFYAFLALGCLLAASVAGLEFAEILDTGIFSLDEDEVLPFLIPMTVLGIICWSSRHYLKSLDRTIVRVSRS